ncbi:MAG: hypothetical protein Q4P22_02135, partial [Eubacteriales bacterium]|nr:hypothetical protein [Eubacteriales bacterium]
YSLIISVLEHQDQELMKSAKTYTIVYKINYNLFSAFKQEIRKRLHISRYPQHKREHRLAQPQYLSVNIM